MVPYGGVSTGGRPPSLLALNPGAWVVAGVDIGATHATAALADLAGTDPRRAPEDLDVATGPEHVLGWVETVIPELLADQRRDVAELAAIGIGLPGPVEHSTGRAINPPIMPGWDRYDVPAHVQRAFDVPVLIDNDVNIMALGEQHAHLPDVADLVFIKVAPASVPASSPAASCSAAPRAPPATSATCSCRAPPTSPAAAATRAASRRSPRCRRWRPGCARPGWRSTATTTWSGSSARGDPLAIALVRQAGRDLGEVLATLVNLMNPSAIVIGGSLALAGESLLAGIRETVYQRSLPLATEHLRIVTSLAGERAGVIGAAALAIGHVLSPEFIEAAIEQAALRRPTGLTAATPLIRVPHPVESRLVPRSIVLCALLSRASRPRGRTTERGGTATQRRTGATQRGGRRDSTGCEARLNGVGGATQREGRRARRRTPCARGRSGGRGSRTRTSIGSATLPSEVTCRIPNASGIVSGQQHRRHGRAEPLREQGDARGPSSRAWSAAGRARDASQPAVNSSALDAVAVVVARPLGPVVEEHADAWRRRTPASATRHAHFSNPTGSRRRQTTNAQSVNATNTGSQIFP